MDRPIVVLTEADVAALHALAKDTGIYALKNAEAFPQRFPEKGPNGIVPKDGVHVFQGDGNRKVRGKQRIFVGSKRWPAGLVVGLSDSQHRRQAGFDEWADSMTQDDVSAVEMERLVCLADNRKWMTQREIVAHSDAREQARADRAAAPVLTELQIAEAQGRAIGQALAEGAAKTAKPLETAAK